MSRYIHDMIAQGEHQQLDFKFEINDARKIARSLAAFSNTDGGKLLIGVKDNGRIAGVRTEEEYHMIEAAASLYCKPEVYFTVNRWNIQGKTVLEVDIPRAVNRPVKARTDGDRWMAFIRVADQNLLANPVLLKVWKQEKKKRGTLLEYSETEERLLEYLRAKGSINITKFCRMGKISRQKAEDILSKLILFDVLKAEFSEKGAVYRLSDDALGTG